MQGEQAVMKDHEPVFLYHRKVHPMIQKTLREDHTAAEGKYVAKATRRRRRIPLAGFFLI